MGDLLHFRMCKLFFCFFFFGGGGGGSVGTQTTFVLVCSHGKRENTRIYTSWELEIVFALWFLFQTERFSCSCTGLQRKSL